jgi:hypothetical protein
MEWRLGCMELWLTNIMRLHSLMRRHRRNFIFEFPWTVDDEIPVLLIPFCRSIIHCSSFPATFRLRDTSYNSLQYSLNSKYPSSICSRSRSPAVFPLKSLRTSVSTNEKHWADFHKIWYWRIFRKYHILMMIKEAHKQRKTSQLCSILACFTSGALQIFIWEKNGSQGILQKKIISSRLNFKLFHIAE